MTKSFRFEFLDTQYGWIDFEIIWHAGGTDHVDR